MPGIDPFRRVRAYSGAGTLTSGEIVLRCQFEAQQSGDGRIVIDCEGGDTTLMREWPWDAHLIGTTLLGEHVESRGAHIVRWTLGRGKIGPIWKVRLIAAGLEIGALTSRATTLRYALANLRTIPGNEPYTYNTPDGSEVGQLRIRLRLGEFEIVIEHRPDADAVLKELSVTRGVGVTADAILTLAPDQTIVADEAIGKLCHLFTLGQGQAVAWIYRDSIEENGHVVATFCRNAVTKPYATGHTLISDEDMCAFVQASFGTWDAAEAQWGIRNAVLAYTDAKIEFDYLESRALKMAVVLEHLKRVYLERTGREYILPNELFQGHFEELRSRVMALLRESFPREKGESLGRLCQGLRGLNRTSIKDAIKGVAAELRLPLNTRELAAIVKMRDRLVHAMQFSDDVELSKSQQFSLLATFAGRLILAALGYDGLYYDWTISPPELIKLDRLPSEPAS